MAENRIGNPDSITFWSDVLSAVIAIVFGYLFASILAVSHLAGIVFEAVAAFGVFAVDLVTGQVVAHMDRRNRKEGANAA